MAQKHNTSKSAGKRRKVVDENVPPPPPPSAAPSPRKARARQRDGEQYQNAPYLLTIKLICAMHWTAPKNGEQANRPAQGTPRSQPTTQLTLDALAMVGTNHPPPPPINERPTSPSVISISSDKDTPRPGSDISSQWTTPETRRARDRIPESAFQDNQGPATSEHGGEMLKREEKSTQEPASEAAPSCAPQPSKQTSHAHVDTPHPSKGVLSISQMRSTGHNPFDAIATTTPPAANTPLESGLTGVERKRLVSDRSPASQLGGNPQDIMASLKALAPPIHVDEQGGTYQCHPAHQLSAYTTDTWRHQRRSSVDSQPLPRTQSNTVRNPVRAGLVERLLWSHCEDDTNNA